LQFLKYLNDAHLTNNLQSSAKGLNYLAKPEKTYLNNTNLIYALVNDNANIGNIRETFFYNQLNITNKVNISIYGDFLIDDNYIFEIGGKAVISSKLRILKILILPLMKLKSGSTIKSHYGYLDFCIDFFTVSA